MELISLVIIAIITFSASFSDGSHLTDDIIALFYTDIPDIISKKDTKSNSNAQSIRTDNINNIKKTTKKSKDSDIKMEGGSISSSISIDSINNIIEDSDNLGTNPHSFYKYD